jgi:two-component system, chemotaxis family, CheB/CheR fusion protein
MGSNPSPNVLTLQAWGEGLCCGHSADVNRCGCGLPELKRGWWDPALGDVPAETKKLADRAVKRVKKAKSTKTTKPASAVPSDLLNFQSAANMGIVLLGRDQTIRRFSAKGESTFNLLASDIGRSINVIRHNLDIPDLEQIIADVLEYQREYEREVHDRNGRWYSLRVRPYRNADDTIDGAVLVLVDIDVLKRNAEEIAQAREYAEAILRSTRDMLVVLNADLTIHSANQALYDTFHLMPPEVEGRHIYELAGGQWDIPRLR